MYVCVCARLSLQLNGSVPAELGDLARLNSLYLDANCLSGSLPASIGRLASLQYLYVNRNRITGTIPEAYASLTYMFALQYSENEMRGTIPTYLNRYTRLKALLMFSNKFTGTVPSGLALLSKSLEIVSLHKNSLRGLIPSALCQLSGLKILFLAQNDLVGPIPTCIGSADTPMKLMQELDLSSNCLVGTIPSSLATLSGLTALRLSGNTFRGSVPHSMFERMSNLNALTLSDNKLSGPVPRSIASLTKLSILFLQDNYFTGDPSSAVSTSQALLRTVDISSNEFSGTISEVFFDLASLNTFAASKNCFRGALPENICRASSLEFLVLDGLSSGTNCLTQIPLTNAYTSRNMDGTIPSCLISLPKLQLLHLSGNGLEGAVNELLSQNSTIAELSLAHNRLTGTIPAMDRDSQFSVLDLSYNRISGCIDHLKWSRWVTESTSVALKENRLSGRVPSALISARDIAILSSNIFECTPEGLPQSDPDHEQYRCGSQELDVAMIAWTLPAASVLALGVALLVASCANHRSAEKIKEAATAIRTKYTVFVACLSACSQCEGASTQKELRHLHNFLRNVRGLRALAIRVGSVSVALMGSVYVILKSAESESIYPTYTRQYSYLFSVMYLAGYIAAIVVMAAWIVIILYFIIQIRGLILVTRSANSSNAMRYSAQSSRESSGTDSVRQNYTALALRILYSDNLKIFLIIALNTAVVFAANSAYVYSLLATDVSYLIQGVIRGVLVLFNLCWNNAIMTIIVRIFIRGFQRSVIDVRRHYAVNFLMTFIPIFNTAIIPILTSALLDSSCFENVFVPEGDITASYSYMVCTRTVISFIDGATSIDCLESTNSGLLTTTFSSSFRYNYTCTSALLKNYAPVVLFGLLIKSIASPLLYLWIVSLKLDRKSFALFKYLPILLWPDYLQQADASTVAFDSVKLVAFCRTDVSVLLSFGVASPVIAIAAVICVCIQTTMYLALIGRALLFSSPAVAVKDKHFSPHATDHPVIGEEENDSENNVRSVSSVLMTTFRTTSIRPGDIDDPQSEFQAVGLKYNATLIAPGTQKSDVISLCGAGPDVNFDPHMLAILDYTAIGSCRAFATWMRIGVILSFLFLVCVGTDMSGDELGFITSLWVPNVAVVACSITIMWIARLQRAQSSAASKV
jgi:Leucine-rich repeat (LRR) protein